MDGTVLDLRFDNLFWLEVLPRRWGALRGLDPATARAQLQPRFDAKRGTLEWYCVDHWSDELGFDVPALKHELREEIRYLDGAPEFLDLLRHQIEIFSASQGHDLKLSWILPNDVQGRGADAAGRSEDGNFFHEVPRKNAA